MAQISIQVGPIGIWTRQLEDHPAAKAQETARELEELGYGALWFGEAVGREALSNAGILLAGTKRIVVATGIANIYARDAVAGHRLLCKQVRAARYDGMLARGTAEVQYPRISDKSERGID